MPDQQQIDRVMDLLQTHQRTLHYYQKQLAINSSGFVPPSVMHGIEEAQRHIRSLKQELRSLGVNIDDVLRDEFDLNEDVLQQSTHNSTEDSSNSAVDINSIISILQQEQVEITREVMSMVIKTSVQPITHSKLKALRTMFQSIKMAGMDLSEDVVIQCMQAVW